MYTEDGTYVGNKDDGIDGILVVKYQYQTSASCRLVEIGFLKNKDGSIMSIADYNKFTAAVYGETSGNKDESYAIADVIMNRSNYSGRSPIDIIQNTGIYGYNESSQNAAMSGSKSNADSKLVQARGAVIDALMGNSDSSNGAYFWEGTKYITQGSIYYNANNWFVKQGCGTTPGTVSGVINYLETITIGETVFIINNPKYHGKRCYP